MGPELEPACRQFWQDWPDGFCLLDNKGAIQFVNPATETLLGYQTEELYGVKFSRLLLNQGFCWPAFLEEGGAVRMEEAYLRCKSGDPLPVDLILKPVVETGRVQGATLLFRDRKASDAKMRRLAILTAAVEQSPNSVMIVDLKGTIVYVNPKFCELTGYSPAEVIGKDPSLLKSGKTPPETYRHLWDTLEKGGEWRGEIQDRKKNGELFWALVTISPIKNEQGEVTHFLAIQKDITEQKQALEALEESEARFRQIADMTGEWIWEQDPEGRYIYSSAAVKQILGYQPEEILGKHYRDLFTPEDRHRWQQQSPLKIPYQKQFYRIINRYLHKDGHEVFTESTGIPIFDASGRLMKWRGVDHDITRRKHYEDRLRVQERAMESASVGIDITDAVNPDWPAIYVNPALCRMTGYSKQELLGNNILKLLSGTDTDPQILADIRQAVTRGQEAKEVLLCYDKSRRAFWNDITVSPVKDVEGRLTHIIEIQSDITERRQAEAERHSLAIARRIQQSLLPAQPLNALGVEVAGICVPAQQVGGDYFDFFQTPAGVDAVVADVSGHSIGAALIMAETRSALKVEVQSLAKAANRDLPTVASLLETLNEVMYEDLDRAELFITMFYARYNAASRRLHFANAGHNLPLLLRKGMSSCLQLDADGMIIGVRRTLEFEEKALAVQPGDMLLLYTDGIVEAQNPAGEFFGLNRLCQAFSEFADAAPSELVSKLLSELKAFQESDVSNDDVSLVALRINE